MIKARKASLADYVPYHGEEESKTDGGDEDDSDDGDMML